MSGDLKRRSVPELPSGATQSNFPPLPAVPSSISKDVGRSRISSDCDLKPSFALHALEKIESTKTQRSQSFSSVEDSRPRRPRPRPQVWRTLQYDPNYDCFEDGNSEGRKENVEDSMDSCHFFEPMNAHDVDMTIPIHRPPRIHHKPPSKPLPLIPPPRTVPPPLSGDAIHSPAREQFLDAYEGQLSDAAIEALAAVVEKDGSSPVDNLVDADACYEGESPEVEEAIAALEAESPSVPASSESTDDSGTLRDAGQSQTSITSTDAIMNDEEKEEDIVLMKLLNGKTSVRAATLERLIQRMTHHRFPDTDLVAAFLLTYRSFTPPMKVMKLLLARYRSEPLNEGAVCTCSGEKDLKIIRLRVYNVFRRWVDGHFHDFEGDPILQERLSEFVDKELSVDLPELAAVLNRSIIRERTANKAEYVFLSPPPAPLVPRSHHFSDFAALECARQLTLIEWNLFKTIEGKELLGQGWTKGKRSTYFCTSPNVLQMIRRSNTVASWAATLVVQEENLKSRAHVMRKFIQIAEHCRELNNFNGLMEILAGLQNAAVFRLKKTWERVFKDDKVQSAYTGLLEMMSREKNRSAYRTTLVNCTPPCIPYLGVSLTDVTFIEDGNSDNITVPGNPPRLLINFEKRRKLAAVIRQMAQYQQSPYNLKKQDVIWEYLTDLGGLSDNDLFTSSQSCERREESDGQERRSRTRSIFRM